MTKAFYTLFILLSLSFPLIGHAYRDNHNCVDSAGQLPPAMGSDEAKDFILAHPFQIHKLSKQCCQYLVKNATNRTCTDPSVGDPKLKSCVATGGPSLYSSAHPAAALSNDCAAPLGCYPFRAADLYNQETEDDTEEAAIEAGQEALDAQAEKWPNIERQPTIDPNIHFGNDRHSRCTINYQCQSNNCVDNRCQPHARVCRLADMEEAVPAGSGIKCERTAVISETSGKCMNPNKAYFLGRWTTPSFVETDPVKCTYDMTPEREILFRSAVKAMRSMEWLFATSSQPDHMDCLFTRRFVQPEVGQKLFNGRAALIRALNVIYVDLEKDRNLIMSSVENDQTQVTIHGNETTTKHQIAMRKLTGIDMMKYMKRRNAAYIAYESGMRDLLPLVQQNLVTYDNDMRNWSDDDEFWFLNGVKRYGDDHNCRRINWDDVEDRWSVRYKVKPVNVNKGAFTPRIKDYMNQASGFNFDLTSILISWKYWLLDPLMPGGYGVAGIGFRDFGNNNDYRRTIAWDHRGLKAMREAYPLRITEFYKGLGSGENYLYDPDLACHDQQSAIPGTDEGAKKCQKYPELVEEIADYSFGQFILYSWHGDNEYDDYFPYENLRRFLFKHYEVNLMNLHDYYKEAADMRAKQNTCLEKVIIAGTTIGGSSGIVTTAGATSGANPGTSSGSTSGVTNGFGNNYYGNTAGNYGGSSQQLGGAHGGSSNDGKPHVTGKSDFNVKLGVNNSGNNKIPTDGSASSSSAIGSDASIAASANFLASRDKFMKETNAKAVLDGVDLDGREKALKESILQANGFKSGAGGASNSSSSSSRSGGGSNSGSDSSSKSSLDEVKDENKEGVAGVGMSGQGGNGSGSNGKNYGSNNLSSYGSNAAGSNSANGKVDSTGLSADEQNAILENAKRNKNQLKADEYDSIFGIIKKAYQRNLIHVFGSKKDID